MRWLVCKRCGFVYQDPRPSEEELHSIYSEKFRPGPPSEKYLRIIGTDADQRLDWFQHNLPGFTRGGKALDVGCAAGLFLKRLVDAGWQGYGIEPERAYVAYGREELGLDITEGYFDSASFAGHQFDLVVIAHVIEHIQDPVGLLQLAGERLTDDGYLFVETPNALRPKEPFYTSFLSSPHLHLFSPQTLAQTVQRAGFQVLASANGQRGLRMLARRASSAYDGDAQLPYNRPWRLRLLFAGYRIARWGPFWIRRIYRKLRSMGHAV